MKIKIMSEVEMKSNIIGYKAFNKNKTTQYGDSIIYNENEIYSLKKQNLKKRKDLKLCEYGYHFCFDIPFVFEYYDRNKSVVAEITVLDDYLIGYDKGCTYSFKINRFLSEEEVNELSTGKFKTKNGRVYYFKEGRRHSPYSEEIKDYLPAIDYHNGRKEYFKEGKRHRDNDLPAIERRDGTKEYYKEGIKQSIIPL